jgi:hypothetical protein
LDRRTFRGTITSFVRQLFSSESQQAPPHDGNTAASAQPAKTSKQAENVNSRLIISGRSIDGILGAEPCRVNPILFDFR